MIEKGIARNVDLRKLNLTLGSAPLVQPRLFVCGREWARPPSSAPCPFGRLLQSNNQVREVLSQLQHDLGANAGSLLSIDEDEECVVQVVALFAPAPAPDVLDPATLCKVITFTTNDVAAPHRTGITCWGRLMGWCNHFKSTRHFLFAKCA